MDREKLTLLVGVLTLAIAVLGFTSYMSPTGALVSTGAVKEMSGTNSLAIAAVALIASLTLFARYFRIIK